jgi:hypothetical protein
LLLNNIKNVLSQYEIVSNITRVNHLYVISINHIINVERISKWLPEEFNLWFWKKNEYLILKKALILMKLKTSFWQKSKEIILFLIYKISNYEMPIDYWLKVIRDYYSCRVNIRDLHYISLSKDKAWAVKLPIKIKPKVKYFFFKTYYSKEKALCEAKKYRDQKLDQWLIENKLI